ncbi:MAG: DUF2934 domain-containing protein [Alphaproteobacteria bacterium]|nr:DUF2934 domain-containing protein [Alphaproteobacteria bacterium]
MDRTEQIRARAHQIWESEGCPEGREADHWAEAERQLQDKGMLSDDQDLLTQGDRSPDLNEERPDDMGLDTQAPGTAGIGGSDVWGGDLDQAENAGALPDAQEVELIKPRRGRRKTT